MKKKLRKFSTKGANFRDFRSINIRKSYFELDQELEVCVEKMSTTSHLEALTLTLWRESVFNFKKKIEKLNLKIQPKQTKPNQM